MRHNARFSLQHVLCCVDSAQKMSSNAPLALSTDSDDSDYVPSDDSDDSCDDELVPDLLEDKEGEYSQEDRTESEDDEFY